MTVYRLKATIRDTKPPVWRRVEVPAAISLKGLHEVLQAAFGWQGYHLHEFEIDGERYGIDDGEHFGDPPHDERTARLGEVAGEGDRFLYLYDFGDGWEHTVVVERVGVADSGAHYPRLVGGRRACPPEDCGGSSGYAEFREAVADPEHEEHEAMLEWVGGQFDPEAFDLAGFDERLREAQAAAI